MKPKILDHVALWVAERDRIADFSTQHSACTSSSAPTRSRSSAPDARRGKLTLFEAEGPRERGALQHVAFRVKTSSGARRSCRWSRPRAGDGAVYFDLSEGLRLGSSRAETESTTTSTTWRCSRRPEERRALRRRSASRRGGRAARRGRGRVRRVPPRGAGATERPLLNHLAVLVDSADEHARGRRSSAGIEVADVVDAPNTTRSSSGAPSA